MTRRWRKTDSNLWFRISGKRFFYTASEQQTGGGEQSASLGNRHRTAPDLRLADGPLGHRSPVMKSLVVAGQKSDPALNVRHLGKAGMNRRDRRKAAKTRRSALGRLKLRCISCERAGLPMTKEHFWPQWLTERAGLARDRKIRWVGAKRIPAAAATLPLCADCNNSFGSQLE